MSQFISGYVANPANINRPPSGQVIIFKNILDGLYYAKKSDGTIELINGSGVTGDWHLLGNGGTNPAINFLGTTDDVDVILKRDNVEFARLTKAFISGAFTPAFGLFNPSPTHVIDGVGDTRFQSTLGIADTEASIEVNRDFRGTGDTAVGFGFSKTSGALTGQIDFNLTNDLFEIIAENTGTSKRFDLSFDYAAAIFGLQVRDQTAAFTDSSLTVTPTLFSISVTDTPNSIQSSAMFDLTSARLAFVGAGGTSTLELKDTFIEAVFNTTANLVFDNTGALVVSGTIETGDPGAGAGVWQLGKIVVAASGLDATQYLQVKVDGIVRKIALIA